MKYQKNSLFKFSLILLMVLLVIVGCTEEGVDEGNGPTEPTGLPADPGPGNLAGKIIGTILGQPLAGVMVTVQGLSTITGTNGTFRLDGVGEGILGVVISGEGVVYTRTAAVNTANGRSVQLDAIEVNSSFNLGFYRELARGNHPNEGDMFQTHRWINPTRPTFYIDTNASYTIDGTIDQNQIDTVRSVISQIVPVFTGDFYSSPSVQTQWFTPFSSLDDVPDNSFIFTFDDTLLTYGAYGITFTEPDFISPTTNTINKTVIYLVDNSAFYDISFEEIIAHESGHGLGFRHTSLLPSVMMAIGEYGGLFSDIDRLHMKIMYSRPAGNTDIDNDPIPGAKMVSQPLGIQIHIDRRANFPVPAELEERARSLPRNQFLSRYLADYK